LLNPFFLCAQDSSGPLPAAPVPNPSAPKKPDPSADSSASGGDPENRHIRILRFNIPVDQNIDLPKLEKEGLLLCLKCALLRRVPEGGNGEPWEGGPGSALWNRGGVAYNLENHGPGAAELLLIELKDSYAISQIRVPYSERDPMLVDAPHFRTMFENEHIRVLLLHLKPRDGTEESQFASRLEIAISGFRTDEELAGGKLTERQQSSGEAVWKDAQLKSIINSGDKSLDEIMVELKHPFCYRAEFDNEKADKNPELKKYLYDAKNKIAKFWYKKMPSVVRDGDTGYVALNIKLQPDGTILEDAISFREVFASDLLVEKGVNAIRDAAPFPPLPKSWEGPYLSFAMVFVYNLPLRPGAGCRE
jgi:hypothetical protein